MGFKDSLAALLDVTRFYPFRVYNNYYIRYSTWLGAIFPLGCIVMLVLYGGSSFLAWARVPNNEDTLLTALPESAALALPAVGFSFYAAAANGTFGVLGPVPLADLLVVTASVCTATAADGPETTYTVPDNAGSNGSVTYTPRTETVACGAPVASLAGDELAGRCPDATLCYVDAAELRGSPASGSRSFFRIEARLANTAPLTLERVGDGRAVLFVANTVPNGLLRHDDKEELAFNVSYTLPLDPLSASHPLVRFQARVVRALPSYFKDELVWEYAQVTGLRGRSADRGANDTVLRVDYELEPAQLTTRLVPSTLLFVIARFGQLIAALALCSFLIYRINFASFYFVADDTYYVPDVTVRNFLIANKKLRVKEFENMLVFAFTFGGVERFGLQTRHVHEFFNDKEKRFDRDRAQAVVADVQKFTAEKRVGNYVSEELKVEMLGDEGAYDLAAASAGRGGVSRAAALVGDGEDEEDATEEGKNRALATIREAETTLKLCVLHDELAKMKSIVATLFPAKAKRFRLAERLNGPLGARRG